MPIFNLTIDDTTPLIRYDPPNAWSDSSHTDTSYTQYSNQTFHTTNRSGATATLTFNGSAVYLFGAFRSNHDVYVVTLDGDRTVRNGHANGTDEFQQLMFSATNLGANQHDLVLTNNYTTVNASWVDVDYIVVTSGDGKTQTQAHATTLDDGDPSISYSDGWADTPNGLVTNYYNNIIHVTNQTGAHATISFEGNEIAVYGATSDNHGLYTVVLDGGLSMQLNGSAPRGVFRPRNMLYHSSDLSNDRHALQIQNIDTSASHYLDLDEVVVSKWGRWSADGNTTSSHSGSHVGSIVGGVIGGVVGLIAIILALFIFCRAHRRKKYGLNGSSAEKNNRSNSRTMIEPFDSSRSTSTPANAVPSDSSGDASRRILTGAPQLSSIAEDPFTHQQPSALPPTSKQTSPRIPPPSTGSSTASANEISSNHPTLPSALGESMVEDVPPPNYAEATAHQTAPTTQPG
ncbi:hypothetical protein BDY19DRAFT_991693 [Irpex rosettiformis]|uniref:Uncharacterized protein n=1 Tax=Irpex rosettiformis TaxID=378272 RepID=A0ACB8UA41_9APHY|nr:hypothetical protein BDY19DRAFT_991693 [Irpex rosettiformis]